MNITPATIMQLISTKQALEDILKNIKYTNCTIEHGQLAMHLTSYMILIVMTDDVNDSYMRTHMVPEGRLYSSKSTNGGKGLKNSKINNG